MKTKTMAEIREFLSEQMDSLRKKETTPAQANAMCNTTGKYLSTIKMQMEYVKLIGAQPDANFLQLMGGATPEKPAKPAAQNG